MTFEPHIPDRDQDADAPGLVGEALAFNDFLNTATNTEYREVARLARLCRCSLMEAWRALYAMDEVKEAA